MSPRHSNGSGLMRSLASGLLMSLALAGCALLQHSPDELQTYDLTPPRPSPPSTQALPTAPLVGATAAAGPEDVAATTLLLARPLTAPGLDTVRIAVTRADQRLDYLAHRAWAAPLPELVQARALETLRAAGHFRAVESEGTAFASQYLLQLEIRRFEVDYRTTGAPLVHVQLVATLGRARERVVLNTLMVERNLTVPVNRMQSISAGFQSALDAVLTELVVQLVASLSTAPGAAAPNAPTPAAPAPAGAAQGL